MKILEITPRIEVYGVISFSLQHALLDLGHVWAGDYIGFVNRASQTICLYNNDQSIFRTIRCPELWEKEDYRLLLWKILENNQDLLCDYGKELVHLFLETYYENQ